MSNSRDEETPALVLSFHGLIEANQCPQLDFCWKASGPKVVSGVTTADCHSTFHFDAIVGEMCFTLATKQTQIPLAFYGNGRTRRGWRGVEPRKPCDEPACLCPKAFAMMYILNCPHALA